MVNPLTIDDWLKLAAEKERAAKLLLRDSSVARQTWMLCGEGAEYLLKALVMRRRGLNGWPDRDTELHTHDIRKLMFICGILPSNLSARESAAFAKAMEWNRFHDYEATQFPVKEAKDIFEAVFGKEGVAEWIRSNL